MRMPPQKAALYREDSLSHEARRIRNDSVAIHRSTQQTKPTSHTIRGHLIVRLQVLQKQRFLTATCVTAWGNHRHSGLVVGTTLACAARGPGSNQCCKHFVSIQLISGQRLLHLTAVPRSTQSSTLRRMVKCVSALWLHNNTNGDGRMTGLQADWTVKFAAWPTNWQPHNTHRISVRGPGWILAHSFPTIKSTMVENMSEQLRL